MVALIDIKKSVNAILKTYFPGIKIYAGEVTEGFIRPAFFTSIIPISTTYDTINYTSHKLIVVISYFSREETELDNLMMADELRKAFGMTLSVKHRHFALRDVRTDTADGVLQFKFDLNYFDGTEKKEEHELMKELELKQRGDI